jgi:hypothetical protein
MIRGNCILSVIAIVLLAALVSAPVHAQTRVGEAVVVKNQVVRVTASASRQINVGDGLLRDETVRTGLDSAARLVMSDSTNLSLGPNSSLKLDRTVFNDEHTYREIAIRLTTGAFRFVTGNSDKAAYKITTALATIGVRGTEIDVRSQPFQTGSQTSPAASQPSQTIVVLQHGAATVCTMGGKCIDLTQHGDTAIITSAGGKITIQKTNSPPWTFAAVCAAAAGLCTVTQYANANPTITPVVDNADPTGILCGR